LEKKRKRRSDRTHLVYQLTNTVTGEIYIGVTVVTGKAYNRSLNERWKRHVSRAKHEDKCWSICESIREHGDKVFRKQILEKIRGKAQAHARETELIHSLRPALNSTVNNHLKNVNNF
jgi:hypothetical protein